MHKLQVILLSSAIAMMLAATAAAAPVAMRFNDSQDEVAAPPMAVPGSSPLSVLGSPADLDNAIQLGGDYGRRMQADVTEDNAGNGGPDTDPDDAGWDWSRTSPPDPYEHSSVASPTNLYGVCSLGLYYAHLRNPGDAGILQAMTDAAVWSKNAGGGSIRTSADMIFLMLYADLVSDGTFADAAKDKMDARVAAIGTDGQDLAEYIRDVRGVTQGYPNGIIAWDIGAYVVASQMLYDRYGAPYDDWADQMAEVLWQDSFNDTPGYFDIIDDAGWDETYGNVNFWWYTLGISGLIDAFETSGSHTAEIPGLVQRILDSQAPSGAICFSYGVHDFDEDWQSTAYAAMSLARHDQITYQLDISHMAYYMAATQDPTYGSWLYSDNSHYPEVGLENVSGMYFGEPPTAVLVDDDFVDQAAVDIYNAANNTSYVLGYDAFGNIQDGVNAVVGSTVTVLPGTYEEQVVITTDNLVLAGSGVGSTVIRSPTTLATIFTSGGNPYKPVLCVDGATGVVIHDLTLDGYGRGNSNVRFVGIAYWNAGGLITDVDVIHVEDTPFSGAQHGVGIYAHNNDGGPYDLEVANVSISDFQKNGTVFAGTGLTLDVHDCVVTGKGNTAVTAQNGIQISAGAGGTVTDCSITGTFYTGPTWTATGLLIYGTTPVDVSGTPLTDCQTATYWVDASGSVSNAEVTGNTVWGAIFYNTSTSYQGDDRRETLGVPQPFDTGASDPDGGSLFAAQNVTVSESCFTGTGVSLSEGIDCSSEGGPMNVTVTNTTVTGWDYGFLTYGAAASLDAADCSITSNLTAGYDNTLSLAAQDAEYNWWGAADGPSGLGVGSGDAVLGSGVDFDPWRTDGTSTTVCAFTPTNTNAVTPGPAPSCISTVNPCITIPVNIARSDNADLRGFSIQVTLSPELTLCGSGISEGTYLNSIGGTQFQVTGSNPYTVDCAILGLPCGATAATGNLFDLEVASASATATGTISITGITLRDCSNQPIPGSAGAPLGITIDNTPPAAVTNLAAAQVKSGNDSDGTTKITLTFTTPGDAAVTEVWRAPFGNYPEYDDNPNAGSAPSVPSYPPGAPWTLTSVTGSGQTDEMAWPARDVWYFTVFTKDACGNVSTVSNMTEGTLNYHLGDVTNGIAPPQGDNLVNTVDITLLGTNYGISLGPDDPLNYLDVGPTTDYSVDGRPTTDNQVNFEDLIVFAINYGQVGKNAAPSGVNDTPDGTPALVLRTEATADGILARLVLADNPGNVKGIHAVIESDPGLTLVTVEEGALLAGQSDIFFRHLAENGAGIHAVALGNGVAIHGSGEIATLRFRGRGDVRLDVSDLRDLDNRFLGEPPTTTAVAEAAQAVVPERFALLAAQPNPFNPSTTLRFNLPVASHATLAIYDVSGQLVRMLVDGNLQPGEFSAYWDGRNGRGQTVSSGVYLARMRAGHFEATQKLQLLK